MSSPRITLALLVVASTGCAPTVTIAEGSAGEGGEATKGGQGNGGTMSTGGAAGGSAPGGAGSVGVPSHGGGTTPGGTGGGGGSGGSLPDDCRRPLPTNVSCNWQAALGTRGQQGYCYRGGCHNAATTAGGLDLTTINEDMSEDQFFIARLLNVPARHRISCNGQPCVADGPVGSTCDKCAMCTPDKVLVSTEAPGTGWVFDTLAPFIPGTTTETLNIGCGDAMPTYNTAGTDGYTQAHKDCLIEFFTAIASTPGTWPCGQQ
jgi:hypothetical protein